MAEAPPNVAVSTRVVLGAAAAVAVLGWIRAVWGLSVGEISLPILYGVTAFAAAVAAVKSRALRIPLVCIGCVCAVAVADGLDPGERRPRGGTGTLTGPEGLLWMRLPPGWVEDSAARVQKERYFLRKYLPPHADPTAVAQLEVQVIHTANRSWDHLQQSPGLIESQAITRGAAAGHTWRIEHHGEGQTGIELHYAGRRIFVRFKAALNAPGSGQRFSDLRPQLEAVLDSVRVVPGGWFQALDESLFGA